MTNKQAGLTRVHDGVICLRYPAAAIVHGAAVVAAAAALLGIGGRVAAVAAVAAAGFDIPVAVAARAVAVPVVVLRGVVPPSAAPSDCQSGRSLSVSYGSIPSPRPALLVARSCGATTC